MLPGLLLVSNAASDICKLMTAEAPACRADIDEFDKSPRPGIVHF